MNSTYMYGRKLLKFGMAAILAITAITLAPAAAQASLTHPLYVSLTFDDGAADHVTAAQLLANHGMKGTFYINSGNIGLSGYLTSSQLAGIAAQGMEIGGHTVTHQDLITLDADEQNRQICTDRDTLLSWGYQVQSFAYPFADLTPSIEGVAQTCGYNSARAVGDLRSPFSCTDCDRTETMPPVDSYAIRTPDDVESNWTAQNLESLVAGAESTGGWIPFNFHHVCDGAGCPLESIPSTVLDAFLTWLQPRTSVGTSVKTVAQVIGGTTKPAVAPTAPLAPGAPGVNTVRNPSLETVSATDPTLPDCYSFTGYGTNTATQARVTDAHTGTYASQITMSAYTDGDAKLIPKFDLGQCSSQVAQGHTYQVSSWYKSTVPVFFTLYQRNSIGQWSYWTQSPRLAAASTWTQATWVSPVPPTGAVGATFGLTIDSVGTLTTDDYGFADTTLAPAPDGVNALVNPSLETVGADGFPQCWIGAGYGTNTPVWSRVTDAADGTYAEKLQITSLTDGDAKLIPGWDAGNCAPLVTPGKFLTLSASYHASAQTFFTVYTQDSSGNWAYWTQSPNFAASSTYTTASWKTPAVPAGTKAVTFGLTLPSVGDVTTDNYSLISSAS